MNKMKPGVYLTALFIAFFTISCEQTDIEDGIVNAPEIDRIIEEGLRESKYTGAVFLAGSADDILYRQAYGYATLYDEELSVVDNPDNMTATHLFDVASLTKIFATTYGMMALYSDGLIDPDDPVMDYLPQFGTEQHSEITIRHLLSHTSGLVQWFPTYYVAGSAAERTEWLVNYPLMGKPGEKRSYSDLGFMILADLIEAVTGQELPEYLDERIYDRVGLRSTTFKPELSVDKSFVSTSHGNPFEKKMVYDPNFGYQVDVDPESWDRWRNYTLTGEVNDGNAFYTHDGTAGHAGLFATVNDLAVLLQLVMKGGEFDGERIFSDRVIDEFMTEDNFGNGLGWAMDPVILNAANPPEGTVGHTGFTGTNFVLNREENLFYILLTNRQHVGVDADGQYPNLKGMREELTRELINN